MSATPLPSEEVLQAFAKAAIDNAERLLGDASTLLAAGSAPTAHSLAVLALEEIGKAIICCGGFAGSENTVTTRELFTKETSSHSAKLTWARNFVDVMVSMAKLGLGDDSGMADSAQAYLKALQEHWKRDNALKMQGFYVDLSEADELRLPAEISATEADEMIAMSRWAHGGVRGIFIDGTGFELYRFPLPDTGSLT